MFIISTTVMTLVLYIPREMVNQETTTGRLAHGFPVAICAVCAQVQRLTILVSVDLRKIKINHAACGL